jgi:uncharacterized protein YigA (DUF484 family)
MSVKASTVKETDPDAKAGLTSEQVVDFLKKNPSFFVDQDDLILELTIPHESGKAISLLERQVTLLRESGIEARQKLGNLLENARSNDQLFDTTRNLVLALLRAENTTELGEACQDQLGSLANIDALEVIFVEHQQLNVASTVRTYPPKKMMQDFKDIFRLKRTHCGAMEKWQLDILFPNAGESVSSTALCPVVNNGEVLALLAFGSNSEDYFNTHLDTLFLDFIGSVVGAILSKQLNVSQG